MTEELNCGHTCYAEEPIQAEVVVEPCQPLTKAKVKGKRDIVRFDGDTPTAINLEHVTYMVRGKEAEANRITFYLYNGGTYVDLENEEAAKNMFDALLNIWSAE
jgi:hypothetical protein